MVHWSMRGETNTATPHLPLWGKYKIELLTIYFVFIAIFVIRPTSAIPYPLFLPAEVNHGRHNYSHAAQARQAH
jgi:hypothetical protein